MFSIIVPERERERLCVIEIERDREQQSREIDSTVLSIRVGEREIVSDRQRER